MRLTHGVMLVAAALFGCRGNEISGEVDGSSVPITEAVLVQDGDSYDDEDGNDGEVLIWLSSVDDLCTTYADFLELTNEDYEDFDQHAEDVADFWATNLPEEDFWLAWLSLRVSSPSDDLGGREFEGVDWDEWPEDTEEAAGGLTHFLQPLDDPDYWRGEVDEDDYTESWYTDRGTGKIRSHDPGEEISGTFSTTVADDEDGDNVGEVEISFRARRCLALERELY